MITKSEGGRGHQGAIPQPGTVPGEIYYSLDALPTRITLHKYNEREYSEESIENFMQLEAIPEEEGFTYWLELQGLGSTELFTYLADVRNVSKLVLEDISRTYQRPGFEEYPDDGYCFAISRILRLDETNVLQNEQYSFILTGRTLITLDENYEDVLDPIRMRLKSGKGNIRKLGASYLMYAMMDTIVDHYFTLMGRLNAVLESVEESIIVKPRSTQLRRVQVLKKEFNILRRTVWAERDKLNDMIRTDSTMINSDVKPYMKDAYDHCVQLIDFADSAKDAALAAADMYMSMNSNRMNEIMKVLTVISSIFIPLTFIAGVYGMNFQRVDPKTGRFMATNMPELYMPHGYVAVLILMAIIAGVQILFFWRKGWFK